MTWQGLLQKANDHVVAPWLGGEVLRLGSRKFTIAGKLPKDHGWYAWKVSGRRVTTSREAYPWDDARMGVKPISVRSGYLVGDLLIGELRPEHLQGGPGALQGFPRVHLLPDGLDHFSRVSTGVAWHGGPLLFRQEEFPVGPVDEVRDCYLDGRSIEGVRGVPPQLELAHRMLVWRREQEEKRREEVRKAREREERLQRVKDRLGDGETRRAVAKLDFGEAAKAALAVGGAELIEVRPSTIKREWVVRYRLDGARYECVCDDALHIVDAGICLQDHDTGEKGDTYFTLESLPGVTRHAMREGAAIWRHV